METLAKILIALLITSLLFFALMCWGLYQCTQDPEPFIKDGLQQIDKVVETYDRIQQEEK